MSIKLAKVRTEEKALMFDNGNTQGRAYTQEGADAQRRKALVFLAGITAGKTYPEIKADYKEASC